MGNGFFLSLGFECKGGLGGINFRVGLWLWLAQGSKFLKNCFNLVIKGFSSCLDGWLFRSDRSRDILFCFDFVGDFSLRLFRDLLGLGFFIRFFGGLATTITLHLWSVFFFIVLGLTSDHFLIHAFDDISASIAFAFGFGFLVWLGWARCVGDFVLTLCFGWALEHTVVFLEVGDLLVVFRCWSDWGILVGWCNNRDFFLGLVIVVWVLFWCLVERGVLSFHFVNLLAHILAVVLHCGIHFKNLLHSRGKSVFHFLHTLKVCVIITSECGEFFIESHSLCSL